MTECSRSLSVIVLDLKRVKKTVHSKFMSGVNYVNDIVMA